MSNILFLDIDGVLNKRSTKEKIAISRGIFMGVDRVLLKRFQDWQSTRSFALVLSSSWRTDPDCVAHLNSLGLQFNGMTDTGGFSRGQQIWNWLQSHPGFTNPAILDDISFQMQPVARFLVQTSDNFGLLDKHLKKVDKLFL